MPNFVGFNNRRQTKCDLGKLVVRIKIEKSPNVPSVICISSYRSNQPGHHSLGFVNILEQPNISNLTEMTKFCYFSSEDKTWALDKVIITEFLWVFPFAFSLPWMLDSTNLIYFALLQFLLPTRQYNNPHWENSTKNNSDQSWNIHFLGNPSGSQSPQSLSFPPPII